MQKKLIFGVFVFSFMILSGSQVAFSQIGSLGQAIGSSAPIASGVQQGSAVASPAMTETVGMESLNTQHTIGADQNTLGQISDLSQNWEATNEMFAGMSPEIGQANANWSQTNTQIENANQNWSDTNKQLEGANENWGRTNSVLESVTNPASLAVMAAATGAGFVIGTAIAGLAVGAIKIGAQSLYSLLHEKITHTKENQKLIDHFNSAFKEYETTMALALELEKALVKMIELKENMQTIDIQFQPKDYKQSIQKMVSLKRIEYRYLKNLSLRALKKQQLRTAANLDQRYRAVKVEKKQLEGVLEKLSENRNLDICQAFRSIYYNLIIAEDALENYRIDILAAKREWFRRFEKLQQEKEKKIEKLLQSADGVVQDSKAAMNKRAKRQRKALQKDRQWMIQSCVARLKYEQLDKDALEIRLSQLQSEIIQTQDTDGLQYELGWMALTLGLKRFYRQKICEIESDLRLADQYGLDRLPQSLQAESDLRIENQKQSMHDALKKDYRKTLLNAHLLRKSPDQFAQVFIAHLYHDFEVIAADQHSFAAGASIANNQDRNITHARTLLPRLEQTCPVAFIH